MKIGALELIVIFIVALLVIGPDKLPQYARKLGKALREFRAGTADVTQEIRESVIDPLQEAQKPLREAMEPLEELDRDLKGSVKEVKDELNNLGKTRPAAEKPSAEAAESTAAAEPEAIPDNEGGQSV